MSKWTPPPKMTTDEKFVSKPVGKLSDNDAAIYYERCVHCGRSLTKQEVLETVRLYWSPLCDKHIPQ